MVRGFFDFLKGIFNERKIIFRFATNDFKAKYAGAFFGVFWAFIQPLISIFVMWFVFEQGFKNAPIGDIKFMLWFVPAYVPWLFFSDATMASSTSLLEYSYLVKKIKFRVSILPIVKIISNLFVHVFFMCFIFLIFALYEQPVTVYAFQIIYYTACLFIFLVGLSWLTSALSVFFKDMPQIISVILQIGFWITPIFWNPENLEPELQTLLKINPVYYIINGYRDSLLYNIGILERPYMNLYFWSITIICFVLGAIVFKKLRPHFADEM